MGSVWLCGAVVDSCPKGYEFDPGSRQLLGERGSALSLTLAQLYDLQLPSLEGLFKNAKLVVVQAIAILLQFLSSLCMMSRLQLTMIDDD